MPIVYNKFFMLLKQQNKTMYDLRKNKVIGTATLEKMRKAEGHIDTRSIESLCEFLNCQPGDLMEYIPSNRYFDIKSDKFEKDAKVSSPQKADKKNEPSIVPSKHIKIADEGKG